MKIEKFMSNNNHWLILTGALLLISISTSLMAKNGFNASSQTSLAIHGYDPVAYFKEAGPQPGDEVFSYEYQGVTWQFANQQNRQSFVDSPENYLPQYGGFCAYAASKNAIADVDPLAWTIDQGKLYLNYNVGVRDRWRADQSANIIKADGFWPELVNKVQ